MEPNQDVERIQAAIQKLMEEKQRAKDGSLNTFDDDDGEKLLLSKLLSQLGSKEPTISKEITLSTRDDSKNDSQEEGRQRQEGGSNAVSEEIAKELRAVKKQNKITHWLLSALIVITLGWQLSEVSIILKVKDGMSHPFRFLGKVLVGNLNGTPAVNNGNNGSDKQNSPNKQLQNQPLIENPFTSHSSDS